jgi:hypothetical protein
LGAVIETMQKTIAYLSLLFLPLFLSVTNCLGQTQSTKPILRLLTYGLPNFEKQNSKNVVSKKWGIEFYPVAGCIVTDELEDSVKEENGKVEPLIAKKYGKNWRDKFYKEVDIEFKIEEKVTTIIDKIEYIKKRQAAMEKEGNGLHYIMTPVANSTEYNVSVQGWGKWKGEDEWVTYYKLLVDYETQSLKLLSDKIIKE